MIFLFILTSYMSNNLVVKKERFSRSIERAIMIDYRDEFKNIIQSKDLTFFEYNKDILEKIIELEGKLESDPLFYYIEELVSNQVNPFIENDKYRKLIEFGKNMAIIFVKDSEKILAKEEIEELLSKRYIEKSMIKIVLSKMEKSKLLKTLRKVEI